MGDVKKGGGTWRTLRVPDCSLEDRVIPDVMNDVFLPQGRHTADFLQPCNRITVNLCQKSKFVNFSPKKYVIFRVFNMQK